MSTTGPLSSLTEDPQTWKGSHCISVTQLTLGGLQLLFQQAAAMRELVKTQGGDSRLQHCLLANVFYEASTRTSCSFQAAMQRLGGLVLTVNAGAGGGQTSAKKGESLSDTIRCLECYTNITVLRHFTKGTLAEVAETATQPLINAGDGVGEHPTQALLDVFTIWDELKLDLNQPAELTVVMLGDLKHGRTVHSLAKLLATTFSSNNEVPSSLTLRYCAPKSLEMPSSVCDFCTKYGIKQENYTELNEETLKGADVLYVTRVQRERFATDADYEQVKGSYVVDADTLLSAPPKMMILHPLPRVDEISTDVDKDPRAKYFTQMENGMYVRMALLALLLGKPNA